MALRHLTQTWNHASYDWDYDGTTELARDCGIHNYAATVPRNNFFKLKVTG